MFERERKDLWLWDEIKEERFVLAKERLRHIPNEKAVREPYQHYFIKTAQFIQMILQLQEEVEQGRYKVATRGELEDWNYRLYEDILPGSYEKSYANPTFAVKTLGQDYGTLFAFLTHELRGMIVYAIEQRKQDLLIYMELFLELYYYFVEEGKETYNNVKSAIRSFYNDYSELLMRERIAEMFDPRYDFAVQIIEHEDLMNPRYLYLFGDYVGENERKVSLYLANQTQADIDAMARTYTEGFRMGFVNNNLDLSKKNIVNIRYNIGFERIVKAAIAQFKAMGLEPVIYRSAVNSINKPMNMRIGYCSTSANRQYDYDHRFDEGIYLDKAFLAKKLVSLRMAYDTIADCANVFAGPAVIEIFGETPFAPLNKDEAIQLDEKQQKLSVEYRRDANLTVKEYVRPEEYSFTIIAYPIPEIGRQFEAIFDETIKVNTLDVDRYRHIQQCLIDALDQGEFVHIVGAERNRTDLTIALHKRKNPEKETNFENCLADVNIPVGEVFTSPKLTGTNGLFHVTEVYLNELKYKDLELTFQDGMVTSYTCKNFKKEEENQKYIKENLLLQRDSLPMGEFAIGTNTTAYKMGRQYGISHVLPILIAEKTGPHFAIGDTCYSMSEEVRVYNPDGKEIVAKDNECSILRKTDLAKAYFNCHTDITIPYDELKEITVLCKDGRRIPLIEKGVFVLEGTEELNLPLKELQRIHN